MGGVPSSGPPVPPPRASQVLKTMCRTCKREHVPNYRQIMEDRPGIPGTPTEAVRKEYAETCALPYGETWVRRAKDNICSTGKPTVLSTSWVINGSDTAEDSKKGLYDSNASVEDTLFGTKGMFGTRTNQEKPKALPTWHWEYRYKDTDVFSTWHMTNAQSDDLPHHLQLPWEDKEMLPKAGEMHCGFCDDHRKKSFCYRVDRGRGLGNFLARYNTSTAKFELWGDEKGWVSRDKNPFSKPVEHSDADLLKLLPRSERESLFNARRRRRMPPMPPRNHGRDSPVLVRLLKEIWAAQDRD